MDPKRLSDDPLARPERPAPAGLMARYGVQDGESAWALLYEREPDLYDQLVEGESLHPGMFLELPLDGATILDVGAGSGRLTFPCAARGRHVFALEPASGMRRLLEERVRERAIANVTVHAGPVQAVPLGSDSVDLAVSASAFGAHPERGGERGLKEIRRVVRRGGQIIVLWPDDPRWFLSRGFSYHAFLGPMELRFRDLETARRCAALFYPPGVLAAFQRSARPVLSFENLGVNAPRDMCRMTVA